MYYVHASYFKGTGRIAAAVAYIVHREERLPGGQKREIYGIGMRYRGLQGDEAAVVRLLRQDAQGFRQPRYYRLKLTVDDRAAARLAGLEAKWAGKALRDAVDRTFRGAFRKAQGAYVIHENERGARPFGNPHVHVLLGPRLEGEDGKSFFISKDRLALLKERWHRELGLALDRYERRAGRSREEEPSRGREGGAERVRSRRSGGPNLGLVAAAIQAAQGRTIPAARTATRVLPGLPGRLARLQADVEDTVHRPGRLVRRRTLRTFNRLLPATIRRAFNLTRTLGLLLPRE